MKEVKLSTVSIFISIATLITLLFINYNISLRYEAADGKTKALFGLVEYLTYSYKYYLPLPGIISLIVMLYAFNRNEEKWLCNFAAIACIIFESMQYLCLRGEFFCKFNSIHTYCFSHSFASFSLLKFFIGIGGVFNLKSKFIISEESPGLETMAIAV